MQPSLDTVANDTGDRTACPPSTGTDPIEPTVSTRSVAGVTLVRVELRSTVAADLDVRIRNELAGPILPPRAAGVPATGWNADGFRGTVPGTGCLGIGYACPVSSPARSDAGAVSIEVLGPADRDGTTPNRQTERSETDSNSVETAIRSLGRARPPADVVAAERGSNDVGAPTDESPESDVSATDAVPAAVDAWLDAVDARVHHAERLTDATAAEATAVLDDRGGVDALVGLPAAIAADESTLRDIAARADDLAARAAATDAASVVSSLSAAAEVRGDPDTEPNTGGEP